MALSVSYLGGEYTFHHLAALKRFPAGTALKGCRSFDEIIFNVKEGITGAGIIAIDNNLAGDVKGNLERIFASRLHVFEELKLRIHLHLAALPGVPIENIRTVFSHAMAIKETRRFFSAYPHISLSETSSTTEGIRKIAENGLTDHGAIGNSNAIDHYGLVTIAVNIDDHGDNFTRFFLIRKMEEKNTTFTSGKTSMFFTGNGLYREIEEVHRKSVILLKPLDSTIFPAWFYAELKIDDEGKTAGFITANRDNEQFFCAGVYGEATL